MGDGCRLQLLIFLGVMGLVGLYLYKSYLQLRGENPLLWIQWQLRGFTLKIRVKAEHFQEKAP